MNEDRCCGNCCWFCFEDTDGWGQCVLQDYDLNSMHCSDMCEDDYVSRQEMRHHMAVLLQHNRWRRSELTSHVYQVDPFELGDAIDFTVKYMKTFSKL